MGGLQAHIKIQNVGFLRIVMSFKSLTAVFKSQRYKERIFFNTFHLQHATDTHTHHTYIFCFCYAVIGSSCSITSPCRAGVVGSISGCHNGYIQSYSYPNFYANNVERSWYLANPGASTLTLVLLEFNVRKIF